jgi:predicted RND superfamily exporter protein
VDHLAILVFSNNQSESKRFVKDLSKKLEESPQELINRVEFGIRDELRFFETRRALYTDLSDLVRIRDYIRDKIDFETQLRNPLNIFSEIDIPEPRLSLTALKKKYESLVSDYTHFPEGYFATPDEKKRAMLVYMNGRISEIDRIRKMKEHIENAISELNPASYSPDLTIRYTGELQNMLEEQASLTADLELSAVIVTLVVTGLMLLFFRAFRATASLLISLLAATFLTFGIAYFLVGHLNANSAFLGSIVIGNGINFGIIFLSRYLEERRSGHSHGESHLTATKTTAGATWIAALAAGLSYGSLMLTDFRGFSQFGVIGLIGMLLCWVYAFTVLPALLGVCERYSPLVRFSSTFQTRHGFSRRLSQGINQWPRTICGFGIVLTVISFFFLSRYNENILEADLGKARSKSVMEHGAGYYDRYIDEIFKRYLSPIVILPRTGAETREVEKRLKAKKSKDGPRSLIAAVRTIQDFIPKDQSKKIKVIREIKELLPERFLRELSSHDRALVKVFLSKDALTPIRKANLPPLIQRTFTEKDGSVGKLVLVEPPVRSTPLSRPELLGFVKTLRVVADSVSPGIPVAGALPVSADVLQSISTDGPRATWVALGAVIFLVTILFRRVLEISLVLTTLILGVVWMAAIVLAFDLKINFLNFIAFPITFGIGVDYGVNIFSRYRQEGNKNITQVIRNTGSAVGLCSLTTIIGYGSLLLAQSQVFVSFGVLAVIGELTCIFAAIVSMPALLILKDLKAQKHEVNLSSAVQNIRSASEEAQDKKDRAA